MFEKWSGGSKSDQDVEKENEKGEVRKQIEALEHKVVKDCQEVYSKELDPKVGRLARSFGEVKYKGKTNKIQVRNKSESFDRSNSKASKEK